MRCNYGIPWRIGGTFAEKWKKACFWSWDLEDELIIHIFVKNYLLI